MAQLVLQKLLGGLDPQCARRNYPTQATTWTLWSYGACILLRNVRNMSTRDAFLRRTFAALCHKRKATLSISRHI